MAKDRWPAGTPISDIERELFEKSPAMAVASRILGGLGRKEEYEPSLADVFVSSTYGWAKAFKFNAKEEKVVQPIVTTYRSAVRQANRFVLDNDFVEYATEVSSHTPAHKLLYRLQFATLPYDKTWIEFDLRTKVRVMRRIHGLTGIPEGVANRMGLLLERVDATMSTVTMVCEGLHGDNLTCPNMTGYLFTLDERHLPYNRTYHGLTAFDMAYRMKKLQQMEQFSDILKDADAEQIMRNVTRGAMWGYTRESKAGSGILDSPADFVSRVTVPSFLERHGEVAFTPFYDLFERAKKLGHTSMTKLSSVINGEITEFSGMMRWLVCVLAMLNEVPTTSELIKPMHTMRAGLTRRVAAFDFHRVTLRLPKTKPVPWIERHLSNVERKHKAHEVRQHWRTYLALHACKKEEHNWEYDYNEGYRLCGKCMSFSRLIHEHVRGDPSLGWVRKEYMIKPNRQE